MRERAQGQPEEAASARQRAPKTERGFAAGADLERAGGSGGREVPLPKAKGTECPPAKVVNVIFAGLGGQGVIKASDILADVAFRAGKDVKKAEVHGMSQRGGSVTSDVRYGEEVLSPMIPPGEADFLVVLAPSEVEVTRPLLREGGVLIPPDLVDERTLPNRRSLNVALLGALSRHLDLPEALWLEAVKAALPERLHGVNETAFRIGAEKADAMKRAASAGAAG